MEVIFESHLVHKLWLPEALEASLTLDVNGNWVVEAVRDAIQEAAASLVSFGALDGVFKTCLGGTGFSTNLMNDAINKAAEAAMDAAQAAGGFLDNLNIDISLPPVSLVVPDACLRMGHLFDLNPSWNLALALQRSVFVLFSYFVPLQHFQLQNV